MTSTATLGPNTTHIEAGSHVVGAAFLGHAAAFALADGMVMLLDGGEARRLAAHPDAAVLVWAAGTSRVVTGGDDGRIVEIRADATVRELGNEKGRWIDALAVREDGAVAWSAGKQVRARDSKGEVKSLSAPSSVRGLAFLPKGYRLGLAHYNGASLWFPNMKADPAMLAWRGSHLDMTVSPDGNFVVTSMQENSLHGWRIADQRDMRMSGYPAKTRSFSWSPDGRWLATSGAEACIIWPFQTKDGPMGKSPRECGVRPAKVTRVAFHPKALVVAIGYEDGWVLLCRLGDGAEILIRGRELVDTSPISALAWNSEGHRIIFGTEAGSAGLVDLPPRLDGIFLVRRVALAARRRSTRGGGWLGMIWRRLALFIAAMCAVVTSQAPEFAQQYRQRLGGAIDELNRILADFDADAASQSMTRATGIAHLEQSADPLVAERGVRMSETEARAQRLEQQLRDFATSGPILRVVTFVEEFDPGIARRTFETFEPALPFSAEGIVSGLIGFVFGFALFRLFLWPFERRALRRKRRILHGGAR